MFLLLKFKKIGGPGLPQSSSVATFLNIVVIREIPPNKVVVTEVAWVALLRKLRVMALKG